MLFKKNDFEFYALPPWWPGIAEKLANDKWEFLCSLGITEKNYSTDFFLKALDYSNKETSHISAPLDDGAPCVTKMEFLADNSKRKLSENGLEFYTNEDFLRLKLEEVIFLAFEKIRIIPSLYESTKLLAKNIVLLKPQDNFSDTSYSSPKIPFTIFISIPRDRVENIEIRVAESIIHECMHLQLTLLEERMPLIIGDTERYFSPWKGERRNSSGILHALYVFSVILHWIKAFPSQDRDIEYINRRVKQILLEVSQIEEIKYSNDLTPLAQMIARYLLDYLPTDGAI
ncbi:aKG-HExxH-type peptide beta-hydroxylase [Duganella levis]|uniref:HEXXH motif domain-containing protein n=1 Tax=Duganella levis TaxID=2692169 RepID=A0ABW9W5T3_9BURK|nr:HEXXH motif-containing putative peptide modification protein [Duganella levis]MYN28920.1 hypothetical protein [Duganella levis]